MLRYLVLILLAIFTISCNDTNSIDANETVNINGTIYKKGTSNLYTGIVITKHKNGTIIRESNYKNGKEHGKSMFWRADGSKDFRAYFKDGKEHGLTTFWRKNGNKQFEANYKNGLLNGASIWYFASGNKLKSYNYKDDKLDGESIWWDDKGKVIDKKIYKNDKLYQSQ